MRELVLTEFALHSGRIGGATRLAEMGAQPWVIQREGRRASQEFMGYVRSNMKVPLGVKDIGTEVRSAKQTAGAWDEMGGARVK